MDELRKILHDGITQCLTGYRKIGLFLSGGLDSSIIFQEIKEIKDIKPVPTFTTKFPPVFNLENSDADIAAKLSNLYTTEHYEKEITFRNYIDNIENAVSVLEEPIMNTNIAMYYLANKFMSENNIVVTLSGDGGDEIFTGYLGHYNIKPKNNVGEILKQWQKLENRSKVPLSIDFQEEVNTYLLSWLPVDCFNDDTLNNHLFIGTLTHLPEDYLIRNDKLGMNFSMEGRFPFTTKLIKNYGLAIPFRHKLNYMNTNLRNLKLIPRLCYKGILPDYILHKDKSGWSIPKDKWLKGGEFKLNTQQVRQENYYKPTQSLVNEFPGKNKKILSALLYFRMWSKLYKVHL